MLPIDPECHNAQHDLNDLIFLAGIKDNQTDTFQKLCVILFTL